MIYSQAALWGSLLLLASSVELAVWAAEVSAQFVNGETQQAASTTRKKLEQDDGLPPTGYVSERGGASLKRGELGAWGMRWEGVERQT